MSHQRVSIDLVAQLILDQETIQQEQQAIIDHRQMINHNLLLYEMVSQLAFFPKGLLNEFYFALQQRDREVILLLRNRITRLLRKVWKKE
jgi:hypothetical protein